jgi:hypothetical membrane protein
MPGRTGDACAGRLPCDAVLESHRSLRSLWPATAWNSLALRPERLRSTYKPLSTALHDCALVLNLQRGLREPRIGDGPAMTISTQDANRRRLFATSAAAVWIAAGLGYVILEAIAATGFRNHYSYAHNFISDLGITSRGMFQGRMIDSSLACLMNTAFCLQGALFLVGAVLIVRALEAQWAGLFLTLAAANAVGNIVVATFHSGPAAQADGTIWVHQTGALLAIVGGNAAILVGSSIVRHADRAPWYRRVSAGLGVLGLLSFVLLVMGSNVAAINILPPAVWERCSVYSIIAWQMFTSAYVLTYRR